MRSPRALIAAVAIAVAVLAVVGLGGDLALSALPFLALAAMLVCGRYVGEDRILAFHRTPSAPRRRRAAVARWSRTRPSHPRSVFARAPRTFRGLPAPQLS